MNSHLNNDLSVATVIMGSYAFLRKMFHIEGKMFKNIENNICKRFNGKVVLFKGGSKYEQESKFNGCYATIL